ncbi:MAG: ATP-binding protein, partial [Defluviitaleaceae bacterium]|nr:ATP-binding protein [Defluviitaleaceae bacterium]
YDSFINIADYAGIIFFSNRPDYVGRHVDDLVGENLLFDDVERNVVFAHTSEITGVDKIAYITVEPLLGWTVVSFFDAHAIEDINRLIAVSILPTVSFIVIISAIMIWITKLSLAPLPLLVKAAKDVSHGNNNVHFNTQRKDEIGQVSQALSEIVNALNLLQDNFIKAEEAILHGQDFQLEDPRLGGVFDDIFERTNNIVKHIQEARKGAEDASKTKSDFLSKMSHEIRTPMNAILGMSELALRENLHDTPREHVEGIKQAGTNLLGIINNILDFSKIESGKLELIKKEYQLASVVNDIVNIIKVRMLGSKLRLILDVSSKIPNLLYGDHGRIHQVILNLMTNAVKYTETGFVELNLRSEQVGDTVNLIFQIRDSGKGIRKEDLDTLFDEFVQFETVANHGIEGTGLGLAIVKTLTNIMGGEIHVKSEYGEGSEFTIKIPQEIRGDEILAKVDSPQEKPVIVFERRELTVTTVIRTMKDLDVPCTMASTHAEFYDALIGNQYAFAFIPVELYDSFIEKYPKLGGKTTRTKIILFCEFGSNETEDRGLPMLAVPVFSLSIAALLNGKQHSVKMSKTEAQFFTAPQATVLVVDDMDTNLKVATGLLKPFGMTIDTCKNGIEAVASVKNKNYDLVLMDHMMPKMNGIEATQVIRETNTTLPIVALTANAVLGVQEMFFQNGFNDFISKPIDLTVLHNILAKWIPSEKQIATRAESSNTTDTPIEIADVDTEKGIRFSGGLQSYLETLAIFQKDCRARIIDITTCVKTNHLPLYTTYVHALKSACANIGAAKLSEAAGRLEAAGQINIKSTDKFISQLKRLNRNIEFALEEAEKAKPTKSIDIDTTELTTHLANLKTAITNFDVSEIDEITEALQKFTAIPVKGKQLEEILQKAFTGNYKHALALIDALE